MSHTTEANVFPFFKDSYIIKTHKSLILHVLQLHEFMVEIPFQQKSLLLHNAHSLMEFQQPFMWQRKHNF